jgi:hypothetical protein
MMNKILRCTSLRLGFDGQALYNIGLTLCLVAIPIFSFAQIHWTNVDSLYQPLPKSVHVFTTTDKIDTGSFRAYYVIADLKDKKLDFTDDTTLNRRLTPATFYEKNDKPLVVVNCTFFSFETNRSLSLVVKKRKIVAYNNFSIPLKGKDSLLFAHPIGSAIGIDKKGNADVAWIYSDSSLKYPSASIFPQPPIKDSIRFRIFGRLSK